MIKLTPDSDLHCGCGQTSWTPYDRKVIHRDIKPSNLLLDKEGTLWIVDFGLARKIEDRAMTQSGAVFRQFCAVLKLARGKVKAIVKWILLILAVTFLFFWKLTLTHQFSVLVWPEPANQAYSWYHFSAASIQHWTIPLWDPYTHAGRTFVGGMETGVFYPLKFILYLWPFSRSGLFSPHVFHYFYVLSHALAACFLFLLARELGLNLFPAFVAALCFSLSGFMSRIGWPDMLDSAIWLPLVLLFLVRGLNSPRRDRSILYACVAGLMLGNAVLGGRIHIVIMDALVVVSFSAYVTWRRARDSGTQILKSLWLRSLALVAMVAAIGIMFGAVQLLPSIEYAPVAIRAIGTDSAVQAAHKIPYSDLRGELWPRALMALLFVNAFPGGGIGTEGFSPYFGVLPLMLAVFGAWRNWHNLWVRYLASLAVAALFYSLGSYSFLHGLVYSIVPYVWIAREAGRFTYLTHFSVAILAGFGVQSLFDKQAGNALPIFVRGIWWIFAGVAVALAVPALYGKPDVNEWAYYSLLFIIASAGIISYISRGHATPAAGFVLVAIILSDLHGSYWVIRNIGSAIKSGEDYLHTTLLQSRNLATFLNKQQGMFRVHLDMQRPPNIGDLYGIQTTECMMATDLLDYSQFRSKVPRAYDLLNVRFTVRRNNASQPDPVYSDSLWKVYENHSSLPRAWIVRDIVRSPSPGDAIAQMKSPGFDPQRQAIITDTLESAIRTSQNDIDEITFDSYGAQRMELMTRTGSPGLLVLSEVDYPGWQATVNGRSVPVHKVNGLLRGIVVPAGSNKVVFRYCPHSVLYGAVMTCLAPLVVLGLALYVRRRQRSGRTAAA